MILIPSVWRLVRFLYKAIDTVIETAYEIQVLKFKKVDCLYMTVQVIIANLQTGPWVNRYCWSECLYEVVYLCGLATARRGIDACYCPGSGICDRINERTVRARDLSPLQSRHWRRKNETRLKHTSLILDYIPVPKCMSIEFLIRLTYNENDRDFRFEILIYLLFDIWCPVYEQIDSFIIICFRRNLCLDRKWKSS